MIEEIKKSVESNLKEKLNSPFWGAFMISWVIWNWRAWYITFFVDSELLLKNKSLLKIHYIEGQYSIDTWENVFISWSHLIILPFISAYLIIFWLPKLTSWFYKEFLKNENKFTIIKSNNDKELLWLEEGRLTAEGLVLAQKYKIESIQEKSKEKNWDEEYNNFIKTNLAQHLPEVTNRINRGWSLGDVNKDAVNYFIASDIIEPVDNSGKFALTNKGKLFLKNYYDRRNYVK